MCAHRKGSFPSQDAGGSELCVFWCVVCVSAPSLLNSKHQGHRGGRLSPKHPSISVSRRLSYAWCRVFSKFQTEVAKCPSIQVINGNYLISHSGADTVNCRHKVNTVNTTGHCALTIVRFWRDDDSFVPHLCLNKILTALFLCKL